MIKTQADCKRLLDYNPDTGIFVWKHRFDDGSLSARVFNSKFAGKRAGTKAGNGYWYLGTEKYLLHRLAFLYMTGDWPEDEIDHINCDRSDNSWINIRSATHTQNGYNKPIRADNTSGCTGVSYHIRHGWQATIIADAQQHYLGTYKTKERAIQARKEGELKYHGEYRRT